MQYPIFKSIVNRIESSLAERKIAIASIRSWDEEKINATGLEIMFDLTEDSPWLDHLRIHFDWDSFRERRLAKQLKGTGNHPFLSIPFLKSDSVAPVLDVELSWSFNTSLFQDPSRPEASLGQIETASRWMDEINTKLKERFTARNLLSRWHIEVEGNETGRILTCAELITYFQFSLEHLHTLQHVHTIIDRRLVQLLFVSRKVVESAAETMPGYAAA